MRSLALAIVLAATPVAAQEAPPPDIAALPAATTPAERPPGFEIHGLVVPWWTPWSQASPLAATDAWRLRFAVLRVDARPTNGLSVIVRLGFMLPGSPLLDAAATYYPTSSIGVTFGQFRLPLGAAATTLAPQLVMLDRPTYVYAMTKLAFRDVGVMVHGPPEGQAGVHYRVAFASGAGRFGAGESRAPSEHAYLVGARLMLERSAGSRRVLVGASGAVSHDPAVATGSAATDATAAAGVLGRTLAPIGLSRTTLLAGVDASLSLGSWWLQAEAMYLRSRATDDSVTKQALGASLELAWTMPLRLGDHAVQLAVRDEWFDPDRDAGSNERDILGVGVNVSRGRLRWSAFGNLAWIESPATGDYDAAAEITVRAVAAF